MIRCYAKVLVNMLSGASRVRVCKCDARYGSRKQHKCIETHVLVPVQYKLPTLTTA